MSQLIIKHFSTPDERRPFVAHGHAEILNFEDGRAVGLAVFEPGWKWSEDVRPLAGTETCQLPHTCFIVSGRLAIALDDGTRGELGPGDVALIPPGHDAWVLGDEPCTMVDFEGMAQYARREETGARTDAMEQVSPGIH
ncbi:cupin domain-containing protein [Pyxidicoccus fallax]|uniref:Cupin domain-containing protein n=1 Tax=Pyxidicoccus fallax TaxID=394095 RepID=A0A848LMQ1_9BACT|nr:cupin domain-containing protein [Pyxidicoccus fallax]NMO18903.1 cupin domain-containing protein [Pyxidicoccus fallax]NPC79555.1 cupin domain-containing protein [Pyxidicoccus fallax]